MNLKEILEEIKAKKPELFREGLEDETAISLLRAAFNLVGKRVNQEKDGRVTIKEFGTFRVRSVSRGEGRDRVNRRVVNFRSKREADRLPE